MTDFYGQDKLHSWKLIYNVLEINYRNQFFKYFFSLWIQMSVSIKKEPDDHRMEVDPPASKIEANHVNN
jgi:hypothetical protein